MFNLELNEQELNVILQSLNEMPFKHVNGIIQKIVSQAQNQQKDGPELPEVD